MKAPDDPLIAALLARTTSTCSHRYRRRIIHDTKRAEINHTLLVILDDLDFGWTREEIQLFIHRWNQGQPLEAIARRLRSDLAPEDAYDETVLLALHLLRQGKISR